MPTEKLFRACPSFPTDIPVATTSVISFNDLELGKQVTARKLYQACREQGYFLLDLTASVNGRRLLCSAEDMFELAKTTFELGKDTLKAFKENLPHDIQGYKFAGRTTTGNGKLDAIEFYTINQDDLMGNSPPKTKPATLETRIEDCADFVRDAYGALAVVMQALDKELDLPVGTLSSLSPLHKPSSSNLRMIRSHPTRSAHIDYDDRFIKLGGHTDIGTMTMLFNVMGGLQVLPAGEKNIDENWRYVKPQPGCVLVQVADTLVEWTGGLLRSNLHRVVDAPGLQATVERQSLAYLLRGSDDVSLRRLRGGKMIPRLATDEVEETRSLPEWSTWRNKQIVSGLLKPETRGGAPIVTSG